MCFKWYDIIVVCGNLLFASSSPQVPVPCDNHPGLPLGTFSKIRHVCVCVCVWMLEGRSTWHTIVRYMRYCMYAYFCQWNHTTALPFGPFSGDHELCKSHPRCMRDVDFDALGGSVRSKKLEEPFTCCLLCVPSSSSYSSSFGGL